ncbi:MAG: hypothetical protein AAGF04_04810 [Chlamydiota bacterium]
MRFSTLSSFFQHLAQSASEHLAPLYAICCADPDERVYLAKKALQHIGKEHVRVPSFASLEQTWQEPSFFHVPSLFWWDAERLRKEEAKQLASFLQRGRERLLITTAESPPSRLFEEQGVLLDLLPEKKWQQEKRFSLYLQERVKKSRRKVPDSALQEILRRHAGNLLAIFSELDKVLAYIGEGKSVSSQELAALFTFSIQETVWQKAEKFVWERAFVDVEKKEWTWFFSALRKQYQMGYTLASLEDPHRAKSVFPKVWPSLFTKRISLATKWGADYFRKGIVATFHSERKLRETGFFDPILLYAHVSSATQYSL